MSRARTQAALLTSVQRARTQHRKCCAAVTCGEEINPGRIFCREHWFFLPQFLRDAMINTFQDAEWDAHQEAVRQAADHIDAAFVEARDAGFEGVTSARDDDGSVVRLMGRTL